MLSSILDFLFPPQCLGCKKGGVYFCFSCVHNTPRRKNTIVEKDIYAPYSYKEPLIKKSLWHLKFKGVREIGITLGRILYEEARKIPIDDEKIFVVPVPTTNKSFLRRGFNQTNILAESFVEGNKQKYFLLNALKKNYGTKKQTSFKTRVERIKNMDGAYKVVNNVAGKTILLIDDITTTGATLREAQKILKQNGAQNIYALAVAYQELK